MTRWDDGSHKFEMLMGSTIPSRTRFVQTHANQACSLDM